MLKIYKVFFSILFIFIIYKLNNIQININIIEQLTIKSLIIYLLFFILSILLISTRWLIIIKDIYKITFVQSIKISLLSFSLNTATIGGSGDLFKIFLWNKKIKKEQLFNCVVVEKIFGLLAFLLLILIFTGKSIFNLSFLKLLLIIFIYFILIFFLVKNSFLVKNIPYINYYDFLLKNKILNSKKKLIVIFLLSMCIQTSFYANLFIFSFLNFKDIINIYSFFYYSLISLANAVPFFFFRVRY
jgi:hypothetical protein